MSNELLKQEIERAMDNAPLQKALKNFTTAYPGNRARVYKGYDFEALREKVHEVKSYARDHLDEVMAEFIKNAEANGAHAVSYTHLYGLCFETGKRQQRQTLR